MCAAGTGSFVEEQANRMEVSLEEIGNSALKANVPIDLGERCTVLMESKIAAELAAGTDKEDICAGLCRSIVRNYLNRVVGNKRKGEHICLQGGVVHNEGIVAAFYEVFGERLHITPFYDVTGAYERRSRQKSRVAHPKRRASGMRRITGRARNGSWQAMTERCCRGKRLWEFRVRS